MTAVPSDQAVREAIRTRLADSLFVEAGAGTGKTTALVDRVVGLVAAGARLRELAAITFTEAAAAELRDRVRTRLHDAGHGRSDTPLDDEGRARCRAALDELDDATLSTVHGFTQRILAEHSLAAGLPPRFDVLDEIAASVAFESAWQRAYDDLFESDVDRPVLLEALVLEVPITRLRGVARALHEHHDRLRATSFSDAPPPPLDLAPLAASIDAALAHSASCRNADDLLARHLHGLEGWPQLLRGASDDLDRLETLRSLPKLACSKGQQKNWPDVEGVRTTLSEADDLRRDLLGQRRTAALTTLVERTRAFVLRYAQERRRAGTLEFHDLLVFTRDLLRGDPAVRSAVSARYRYLLVDEFQDTDPLQIEIAVLITSSGPADRPWQELRPDPGRLFLVGDPKQSIYRFRRADLAVYDAAAALLGGPDTLRLVENFRSVPPVLDWVNHLFTGLFGDGTPGVQAAHVALHAYRGPLDGPLPAHWFGERSDDRVAVVRAREGDDVAALAARIKREEWTILDGDRARAATYSDIALLLPTRAALPAIEAALERADIPVRIESQSLIFSTAEVRDLLAILAAVDDPEDEVALVAALRTPALGCGDDDLVAYRGAGGPWDYRGAPPVDRTPDDRTPGVRTVGGPVVDGMRLLRSLHERRWWMSVADVVDAVVRDGRFFELAFAHRRPRDHWRRVRFLLDQARAYEAAGGTGLRGFLEWIQVLTDERARAVEMVVPEPDDDALRVLTVHGAKGLEFPIVILAGLNAGPPTTPPTVVWHGGSFEVGVGAQAVRVSTPGYEVAVEAAKAADDAERDRLLYVACTRARDHLLVSLHHSERADTCHAHRLWEGAPDWPAARIDPGLPAHPEAGRVAPPPDDAGLLERRSVWCDERAALRARAARPVSVAATGLADPARLVPELSDRSEEEPPPDAERAPWRRGRAGTSVGRAVHAVLQTVDLDSGAGLEETARAQALAEGIPGREGEVAALARSVLDAPIVRQAAETRSWREVPVATTVDGVVVEGFVDLLVDGPDGLVVVDYKTDRVDERDLEARMDKYRLQGATYALALEQVLGYPVARCVFVFARASGALERSLDDLPAAIADVRERVLRTGTGAGASA